MSLTKLLKSPIKLFRKDIITFLIIHRHDLNIVEDRLRYIAVKPDASLSVLRRKVWHLLDLPDYCDEIIVLKTQDNAELPLTVLKNGNDPQHPYILEVWLPENRAISDHEISNKTVVNHPTKQFYKKADLNAKISSTTIFRFNNNKNKDPTFTNILMKIQNDLCTLSNKLSNLENRIQKVNE